MSVLSGLPKFGLPWMSFSTWTVYYCSFDFSREIINIITCIKELVCDRTSVHGLLMPVFHLRRLTRSRSVRLQFSVLFTAASSWSLNICPLQFTLKYFTLWIHDFLKVSTHLCYFFWMHFSCLIKKKKKAHTIPCYFPAKYHVHVSVIFCIETWPSTVNLQFKSFVT